MCISEGMRYGEDIMGGATKITVMKLDLVLLVLLLAAISATAVTAPIETVHTSAEAVLGGVASFLRGPASSDRSLHGGNDDKDNHRKACLYIEDSCTPSSNGDRGNCCTPSVCGAMGRCTFPIDGIPPDKT
ncbi:hypothetical protein ACHAWF_002376 [Thalassiosira exigua]